MGVICVDDYPQLSTLCWNRKTRVADEIEVLQLYETGWRFIDKDNLTKTESDFINRLATEYGNGVLNV